MKLLLSSLLVLLVLVIGISQAYGEIKWECEIPSECQEICEQDPECKMSEYASEEIDTQTIDPNEIKITELESRIEILEKEKFDLEEEISRLNQVIEKLQGQVVLLVKEFAIFTTNLNDWFLDQMKN